MNNQKSFASNLETSLSQAAKAGFHGCIFFALFVLFVSETRPASLFGDLSCNDWGALEHSRKKTWTNAFLAPLSLTIQGLKRADQDPYNDDPNSVKPAIRSIDKFCLSHPREGAADGAASYLKNLTSD